MGKRIDQDKTKQEILLAATELDNYPDRCTHLEIDPWKWTDEGPVCLGYFVLSSVEQAKYDRGYKGKLGALERITSYEDRKDIWLKLKQDALNNKIYNGGKL